MKYKISLIDKEQGTHFEKEEVRHFIDWVETFDIELHPTKMSDVVDQYLKTIRFQECLRDVFNNLSFETMNQVDELHCNCCDWNYSHDNEQYTIQNIIKETVKILIKELTCLEYEKETKNE